MSWVIENGYLRNSEYDDDDVVADPVGVGGGGIFEMADGVGRVPVFCVRESSRQKLFFENQGRFQ